MTPEEKERFFYQEYVRKGHAQRIREWVTGRHTQAWGSEVSTIAKAIADLLDSTPTRFREYLGLVCESHHRSDLDKADKYPLVARFGSHPSEVANVQYAAILLRTVDLLHVTKDRTPSREYEAIKFSDPKSVEEWDKQLGTFAVGLKGRRLILNKPETAIITINADFTEERPLFALQEYIAYAGTEIQQSWRWAEKSQVTNDGQGYHFPWHEVEGDVRLQGVPPHPLKFELDRGRLLDLLVGHTIYNDPTVAIRELLQNSIDAVRFQHYLDKRDAAARHEPEPAIGRVVVRWNPSSRTLVVQDDGTGMDQDVIRHHLMSVGSSYYSTPQFESENKTFTPISRFGIGILTCFMVSDDIEIVTVKGLKGHRIRMTSVKSTYLLRELERGDKLLEGMGRHGTTVTLRLRDTVDLEQRSVEDILRYWIILPECEVLYVEEGENARSIGYRTVADAIEKERVSAENQKEWKNRQIVVKSDAQVQQELGIQDGHFELAFVVRSGNFPEREFCAGSGKYPQVCIEGIRVADSLPGMTDRFIALLSVRGTRQFRTTVSRSGLEVDDGFSKVGRLCTSLLYGHIRDEVDRISNKAGQPLSQAASARSYLFSQLLGIVRSDDLEKFISELDIDQPAIVMEEVSGGKTDRSIISARELSRLPEFWTLEARSVDSLSLLSRDLGRELSLNQFLFAFAPDRVQSEYSPLIPEAHAHSEVVTKTHLPERVMFSRSGQQSAICWRSIGKQSDGADLSFVLDRDIHDDMYRRGLGLAFRVRGRHVYGVDRFNVYCAPLQGDDSEVDVVKSRIATILSPHSRLLSPWSSIRDLLLRCVKQKVGADQFGSALALASYFSSCWGERILPFERDRDIFERDVEERWKKTLSDVRRLFGDAVADSVPISIRALSRHANVFDATSYWLDWGRTAERSEFSAD